MKVNRSFVVSGISAFVALAFFAGCGKEQSNDEVIRSPISQKASPTSPSSSDTGSTATKSGADVKNPGSTSPNPNPGAPAATAMTLDQAKTKCAGCHSPGGAGAGVWSSANGTEADWKAFAPAAKASVVAGRMPIGIPLNADEKTRLIAFLDGLLGITPPTAGTGPGAGTPNPPPAVITYNFQTARALCAGCHSSAAPVAVRMRPYLETVDQWVASKKDIEDEVRKGSMPRGKSLTTEERSALLNYIRSL